MTVPSKLLTFCGFRGVPKNYYMTASSRDIKNQDGHLAHVIKFLPIYYGPCMCKAHTQK